MAINIAEIAKHNEKATAVWEAFRAGKPIRHFKTLRAEINVQEFETGFPVDFGKLRRELGPEVLIHGGPNIMLLLNGTPEAVREETRRILNSGIAEGGRIILREGNNLALRTPFINLDAMYQEARQFSCPV